MISWAPRRMRFHWAAQRYAAMAHKAGECVECGLCEGRCPYELPIREMLKGVKGAFGE